MCPNYIVKGYKASKKEEVWKQGRSNEDLDFLGREAAEGERGQEGEPVGKLCRWAIPHTPGPQGGPSDTGEEEETSHSGASKSDAAAVSAWDNKLAQWGQKSLDKINQEEPDPM